MTKYWALLTGINHYHFLQPLLYAQRDVQRLHHFLVDQAGLPTDQGILLTDISPAFDERALHPTRNHIQGQLARICQSQLQADDVLWLFFCGYGIHINGQDYLLPIDANPSRDLAAALPCQTLFQILQSAPTRRIMVLLDMSRSQSSLPDQPVGSEAIALAQQADIPIILSCQPGQFSHETLALRSGLFTQALLEGLQDHGCVTPAQLAAYLQHRLPELSQHHWRPTQAPVAFIPTAQRHLLLVPGNRRAEAPAAIAVGTTAAGETSTVHSPPVMAAVQAPVNGRASWPSTPQTPPAAAVPVTTGPVPVAKPEPEPEPDQNSINHFWPKFAGWSILAVLLLLSGVLLRNSDLLTEESDENRPSPLETTDPRVIEPLDETTPDAALPEGQPSDPVLPALPPPPNAPVLGDQGTPELPPSSELPNLSEGEVEAGGRQGFQPFANLFRRNDSNDPEALITQAQGAIATGRYSEAQSLLNQVPADARTSEYEALQEVLQDQLQTSLQQNHSILEDAKATIRDNQASSFNRAVRAALRIQPNQPLYDEAQRNIDVWSQVILDLAEGRAAQGNLDGAIAAAQLVPQERPRVYQQAQTQIQIWRQQQTNQAVIQEASQLLQPGQAHTFEAAIQRVRQIAPGQPSYETAQRLIDQWSREIISIARSRAAQGLYSSAIRAAEFVPPGTIAYDQAQDEIQRWQQAQ